MKLVTFERYGLRHIGAMLDDGATISDFTSSAPSAAWSKDMMGLIDGGDDALTAAQALVLSPEKTVALADVRLLAPLPEPSQMRDFLCFEQHLRQARTNRYLVVGGEREDPASINLPPIWYEVPIYYKCNRFSVIGTGDDVLWPRFCKLLDYELEFGVVLGRGGKNIQRENAHRHIFGYCIFNDMTARDTQMQEMMGMLGPAKGKDFDTGNILGPWLVTADEVCDPYSLTMIARVNGEEWSRGNSGSMRHKFEDILAHVSSEETLHPGEFFGSGTVGNGCGLELGRFLQPGDVIELEVERLGTLRNRVVVQK
jgi:2-keto-4-pentenoate hydratase/2-oxohepta-3-ene-1,7-dioic acid hydratase in catechol pathway